MQRPARFSSVSDHAHHRVARRVDDLGNEEHRADSCRRDTEYVGVVVQQENIENLKVEIRGGIAEPVAQFLGESQFFSVVTQLTFPVSLRWAGYSP